MRDSLRSLIAASVFFSASILADNVWAAQRAYVVIGQPGQSKPYVHPRSMGRGRILVSRVPRYAYGWFGANSTKGKNIRHFGYYRNFTQWSSW